MSQSGIQSFIQTMKSPLKMGFFMFQKLPSAYFSGVRVKDITPERAEVTVPYKWFSQNPFRSTYFACQAMAAEMSTGLLAMMHIHQRTPAVSMLVLHVNGSFHKKATGITTFTCEEGDRIRDAVEKAIATGEGVTVDVTTKGWNDKGELVSSFDIRWTFKSKHKV
jgi:acyl-coenzyme A thioesterase PaaI-like protein